MDLVVSELMEEGGDSGAEHEEVVTLPVMEETMCQLVNGDAERDFPMVLLCEAATVMDMGGEGVDEDGRRRKVNL